MIDFKMDQKSLVAGLSAFEDKADIAIRMYLETAALKLQNDAKENAKWTDRTGDARKRLRCTTSSYVKGYKLTLAHGVDYGVWLELAHEKKFATIADTIRFTGTLEVMPGFEKLLERLRG